MSKICKMGLVLALIFLQSCAFMLWKKEIKDAVNASVVPRQEKSVRVRIEDFNMNDLMRRNLAGRDSIYPFLNPFLPAFRYAFENAFTVVERGSYDMNLKPEIVGYKLDILNEKMSYSNTTWNCNGKYRVALTCRLTASDPRKNRITEFTRDVNTAIDEWGLGSWKEDAQSSARVKACSTANLKIAKSIVPAIVNDLLESEEYKAFARNLKQGSARSIGKAQSAPVMMPVKAEKPVQPKSGSVVIDIGKEEGSGKVAKVRDQGGPAIVMKEAGAALSVTEESYRLACEVSDARRVDAIRISANGVVIPLDPSTKSALGTSRKIDLLQSMPLQVGDNRIVVTAYNGDNQSSSRELIIKRAAEADIDTPPVTGVRNPDAVAVVIGISKYMSTDIPGVDYAVRDARVMKQYLIRTLGFDEKRIFEYYDGDALQSKLRSRFNTQLKNSVTPGKSDVFIYYSGHGVPDTDTKEAYFAPYDFDSETIADTGYALKDFYSQIEKYGAKSTTVVIDACFSGSSERGMIIKSASPVFLKVSTPTFGARNGVVFTSSSGEQISSWYHEKKHGLFTYYFLSGLQGKADSDGNGQITASEMEKYLNANVPKQARALHNREQTPEVRGNKVRVMATLK